ncbi:MAG: nitrate/sulfonate/bicarbonate ABC transporter ATP-binding protein [Zestosphaera tikiterensis]|uniref:Nitrate/sulfonate/bicarbonate ABC transporter ATP-binding protein n=1 Tax=Zestosphaera tikiterensis TaxID=1973259 RepID=A0A2R7Y6J9_9CREN|nr:MAG: nitrate/sulfonate/bicarbonate ABC transporter ATP-binding protein [Zestosphaera tikiterensis]
MTEVVVSIKELEKEYLSGRVRIKVLNKINLEIRREFLAILGPSGCGKSTLLRILAGVEKPTKGTIEFHISSERPRIGFVFQFPTLIPWLTILENVALPLESAGIKPKEARDEARKYLSLVGLSGFENAYPHQLSGGMKQRVNITRALAIKPQILLLDEPFSNLDPLTAEALRAELLDIWLSGVAGVEAVVMVTHSIDEALFMADRIAILTPRPAEVRKVVEVNLPRPRNRRSPEFQKLEDYIYEFIS